MFSLLLLSAAAAVAPQNPIDTLASWDLFSSMSASTITDNSRFGYVAAGSSISVLHLSATPPCEIGSIPMDAQAREILAANGRVFVAGGTAGLLELTQPAGLQCGVALSGFSLQTLDDFSGWTAVPGGGFQGVGENGLECLALGMLSGHPQHSSPLLLALFSGRTLTDQAQVELRFYTVGAGAPQFVATYSVPVPNVASLSLDLEVAAANTADGKRFVYVANGVGGVVRLNVADLGNVGFRQGPTFDRADQLNVACGAARATHLSLTEEQLFVAIDRAGLASIPVSNAAAWAPGQSYWYAPLLSASGARLHAYRVSAVRDATGNHVVAVGTNVGALDPVNGFYFDLTENWSCDATPQPTPCNPGAPAACDSGRLHMLRQLAGQSNCAVQWDASTSLDGPCVVATAEVDGPWSALRLRKKGQPAGTLDYEVFGSLKLEANRWEVVDPHGPSPTVSTPPNYSFSKHGTGPLDALVSERNPDLILHCSENNLPIGIMQLVNGGTQFAEVPNTRPTTALSCDTCQPTCGVGCKVGARPYVGSIFDGEHWLDTGDAASSPDPEREWFLLDGVGKIRKQCATECLYERDYHFVDPLTQEGRWKNAKSPGWTLTSFNPLNLPTMNDALDTQPTGAGWNLLWWQILGPTSPFFSGPTGGRYWSSHLDRGAEEEDQPLYLLRWLVPDGVTIVSRRELELAALNQCPAIPGSTTATGGSGQFLDLDQLHQEQQLSYLHKLMVHFEHALIGGAEPYLHASVSGFPCIGPGSASLSAPKRPGIRSGATARATTFTLSDPQQGDRRILAIAAGHANNPIHPDTNWSTLRLYKPMVVFYDVTGVSSGVTPTPVRLLFGPTTGDALNIDIAQLGNPAKPYGFVGDLLGRIYVYDLSNLLGGAFGPAPGQALDTPIATWSADVNRWDLRAHNVADVELEVLGSDAARAYVANGQGGLTVVTFSGFDSGVVGVGPPSSHDTPVFATGIALRPPNGPASSLILSDTSGSGLKLFTRAP